MFKNKYTVIILIMTIVISLSIFNSINRKHQDTLLIFTEVILISSNSVILSKYALNNIDAENIFLRKIENIKLMGSKARVFCNIGFDIVSDISEYSFKKMDLNINDEIYVIFKSENVKISYT